MSLWRLAASSLWFYWRTNLAVLLAVVVATGVLTGALAVGDSVQYTLRKTLDARLGAGRVRRPAAGPFLPRGTGRRLGTAARRDGRVGPASLRHHHE